MGELDKLEAFAAGAARAPLTAEDVAAVLGRGHGPAPLQAGGRVRRAAARPSCSALMEALLEDGEAAAAHPGDPAPRAAAGARRARARGGARAAARTMIVAGCGLLPFKVGRRAGGGAPLVRGGAADGAARPGRGRPADQERERSRGRRWRRRWSRRAAAAPARGRLGRRAASALTRRVRRLLYRAAALSWTTPFLAALSISLTVSARALLGRRRRRPWRWRRGASSPGS